MGSLQEHLWPRKFASAETDGPPLAVTIQERFLSAKVMQGKDGSLAHTGASATVCCLGCQICCFRFTAGLKLISSGIALQSP